jgi:hypothetical protein
MPEGNQDHGGVPVPVTVFAGRLHEPLDLGFGEVLPVPRFIWLATRRNCPISGRWDDKTQC